MNAFVRAAGKSPSCLVGAVCGFALAIPLAAVALGASTAPHAVNAATAHAATLQGPRELPTQAQMVNRSIKGARLDLRLPPAPVGSSMMAKNVLPGAPALSPVGANGAATAQNAPELQPARAARTPKGCVSALGPTRSSLATEDLTICVASAEMVGNIIF
ncbi:hypothetical protein [Ancylobacter sp. SL191]|jgi:hypothetical protein|uniref:hypothetical protein n=1 Tax=Ancylobacter sp. SL191 TaxID=2995166 RepID=UPI00226F157C|nr:hypothetical protein [Ancylobacter sp. SL191]WAC27674.1 hypothetical protein OU996_00895 [Ancylobacter sp. SL191]